MLLESSTLPFTLASTLFIFIVRDDNQVGMSPAPDTFLALLALIFVIEFLLGGAGKDGHLHRLRTDLVLRAHGRAKIRRRALERDADLGQRDGRARARRRGREAEPGARAPRCSRAAAVYGVGDRAAEVDHSA